MWPVDAISELHKRKVENMNILLPIVLTGMAVALGNIVVACCCLIADDIPRATFHAVIGFGLVIITLILVYGGK